MSQTLQITPPVGIRATIPSSADVRLSWIVVVFLFSLIVPLILNLGPLRLSVYRLILLVTFIPCFIMWLSGRSGRILAADLMVVLMVFWMSLAHLYHFGVEEAIEPIGILTLEHLGAYLLARAFIRSAEAFRKMAWLTFLLCLILLPFGVYESLTTNNLYLSLWDKLGTVPPDVPKDPRLGLDRFQGPFDHPILPGVFAAPILGLTCYVLGYQRGFISTTFLGAVVFITGFLCVSSGPLSALAVQLGLIIWNRVFIRVKTRWWVLLVLTVIGYIVIDLISNRTPIEVAISYLALNSQTGLARVYIFHWGWVNILENPIFGIGDNDWKRYAFMTESFDMFWLLYAMKYGLITGLAQTAAPMLLILSMIFTKMPDPRLSAYRMGWLVGIAGIIMAGWMVHFWKVPLVLFYFVLGAGCWMLDDAEKTPEGDTPEPADPDTRTRGARYSRFASRKAPTARTATPPLPRRAQAGTAQDTRRTTFTQSRQ